MLTPFAQSLARLGISQGEVARRTGLTRQTVWDAYHGRGDGSLLTWVRISKAIGVPLVELSPEAAAELHGLVVA